MGAARAWKHRFFALFLVLLLGMQKKNMKAKIPVTYTVTGFLNSKQS
jgi:hypothetical protein